MAYPDDTLEAINQLLKNDGHVIITSIKTSLGEIKDALKSAKVDVRIAPEITSVSCIKSEHPLGAFGSEKMLNGPRYTCAFFRSERVKRVSTFAQETEVISGAILTRIEFKCKEWHAEPTPSDGEEQTAMSVKNGLSLRPSMALIRSQQMGAREIILVDDSTFMIDELTKQEEDLKVVQIFSNVCPQEIVADDEIDAGQIRNPMHIQGINRTIKSIKELEVVGRGIYHKKNTDVVLGRAGETFEREQHDALVNNRSIIKQIEKLIDKYSDGSQSQKDKGEMIEQALNKAISCGCDLSHLGSRTNSINNDKDFALFELQGALNKRIGWFAPLKTGDSTAYKNLLQEIKSASNSSESAIENKISPLKP